MTEIKRGLGSEYRERSLSLSLSLSVASEETQQQAI